MDYFRMTDHPEGGQTSQYKRVYRYRSPWDCFCGIASRYGWMHWAAGSL